MAPCLDLPYEIWDVTKEEDKIIKKCLLGYTKPFVKCGEKGYVMPGAFRNHAEAIYNLEVRPDDIWVITFPRSGTTWTQEMVWLIENDLDFETAKEKPLYERFPMLELTAQIPELAFQLIKNNFMNLKNFQGLNQATKVSSWKTIEDAPSPRLIKTHLPLSMLPPNLLSTAKVIYVARDPRDVAVSYYYLHKMVGNAFVRTTFQNFWEAFRRDLLPWTPIIEHTNEAWKQRHNENLHFIFYEEMIKDLPKIIHGVSKFLNRDLAEKEVNILADHLSFDNLRKNKTVNNSTNVNGEVQFIRKEILLCVYSANPFRNSVVEFFSSKRDEGLAQQWEMLWYFLQFNGEAGGWRSHFDAKMEMEAEEFITSKLRGLDIKYPSISSDKEGCSDV